MSTITSTSPDHLRNLWSCKSSRPPCVPYSPVPYSPVPYSPVKQRVMCTLKLFSKQSCGCIPKPSPGTCIRWHASWSTCCDADVDDLSSLLQHAYKRGCHGDGMLCLAGSGRLTLCYKEVSTTEQTACACPGDISMFSITLVVLQRPVADKTKTESLSVVLPRAGINQSLLQIVAN